MKLKQWGMLVSLFISIGIIFFVTDPMKNNKKNDNVDKEIEPVSKPVDKQDEDTSTTYTLELERWNIYNDGTHPVETTKGLNDALQWANENGVTAFKVPKGTYLIKDGEPFDPGSRINMVSDMTFWMEEGAVLQKETNGKEQYELFYIGPGITNVTLKGGTYRGDADTHDYTGIGASYLKGTHEFGYGIISESSENLILDGVKTEKFTGDGIFIGGKPLQISILKEEDFEIGSIDKDGNLIKDSTKIRTKNIKKTSTTNEIFRTINTIQFSRPQNLSKKVRFDIFFYKENGTFIKSINNQEIDWSLTKVPDEASYYHAVFDTPKFKGIRLEYWNKGISKNVVIKNSESSFNRRQGITVAGVEKMQIINNVIHDIKGTAPQSGIDLEAGFYPNKNIVIKDNKIFNIASYNLILYDGQDVEVEGNYFGPNEDKSSIGLAVSEPFRSGALIKNNTFEGAKIAISDHVTFEGNIMKDSVASIGGPDVTINGMEFIDSQLRIGSKEPFGVKVNNVKLTNNKKTNSGLVINEQPIHIKNMTINGESTLRNLIGEVAEGSIFDNLKVINYNSIYGIELPRGTYNDCVFEAAFGGKGTIKINQSGKYVFNNCSFKTKERTLSIENEDSNVTINNSSFETLGNGETIYVQAGKKINIENNLIKALHLTSTEIGVIKINDYQSENNHAKVLESLIRGNKITTDIAAIGISTIGGAAKDLPYTIEDNTLYNAKLKLKASDLTSNNKELTK